MAAPRNVTTMLKLRPISFLVGSMTKIIMAGPKPLQKITLGANIVGDSGEIFQSHAHYIADKHGEVDVYRDSSLGGSYSGVEPMGLLWSMKQAPEQKKGLRLYKRDVTKPYNGVLRANAQKNRAKSENRGHSSKRNLPSFSVCNKVLMSL